MFKEFKENGLNEQLGNLDREMTTIKMKILKLKSTGAEMRNSLDVFKGRLQCQEKESANLKSVNRNYPIRRTKR